MSCFITILHKIWGAFVEGKGLSYLFKKIWEKIWNEIDCVLGIFARWILMQRTPIDPNKVFFHTQESKYTCNPKYICEELMRKYPDVDIVWRVTSKINSGVPKGLRTVKLNSYQYFKEIFSSNVIVTNSFLYVGQPFSLKKGQTLIETWHGSLGIKRHDKNAIKDSKKRVRALEATGKMTDYCISNSSLETGSLRSTYWSKNTILELGHARNDLFFPHYAEERRGLRKKFYIEWGLDADTKTVMYAPTFRDDKNFDCYNVDFSRMVDALGKRFGGKWCVLLRYHPSLAKMYKEKNASLECDNARIIDVTEHPDMQELIAVTDVGVTDYSSWIYDFVLLRRPGFIFATDIEQYNNERGFYYPIEETPFPIATNNEELVQNILDFDNEKYLQRVEVFLADKGCVEDGHASERAVELIMKHINDTKCK